jgi:hypothetical protein
LVTLKNNVFDHMDFLMTSSSQVAKNCAKQ